MEQKEEEIPFHTRFGLRLLQALLVLFALLLVKRCVDIYHDNRLTSEQTVKEYFEKGFAGGMKKAQGSDPGPEPQFRNYALEKAYREGYRQGWDKVQEKK